MEPGHRDATGILAGTARPGVGSSAQQLMGPVEQRRAKVAGTPAGQAMGSAAEAFRNGSALQVLSVLVSQFVCAANLDKSQSRPITDTVSVTASSECFTASFGSKVGG